VRQSPPLAGHLPWKIGQRSNCARVVLSEASRKFILVTQLGEQLAVERARHAASLAFGERGALSELQAAHARSALDFDGEQPSRADLRHLLEDLGLPPPRPSRIKRLGQEILFVPPEMVTTSPLF
jgi:hypothetical protein